MEIFMDDFSFFRSSFIDCLKNLATMLQRCKEKNLAVNWEKCHFMVKEGIVLGHKYQQLGWKWTKLVVPPMRHSLLLLLRYNQLPMQIQIRFQYRSFMLLVFRFHSNQIAISHLRHISHIQ